MTLLTTRPLRVELKTLGSGFASPSIYHKKEGLSMYSAEESQAIKDRAAIRLLKFKMQQRLVQDFDTLLLSDVNDVLMVFYA